MDVDEVTKKYGFEWDGQRPLFNVSKIISDETIVAKIYVHFD